MTLLLLEKNKNLNLPQSYSPAKCFYLLYVWETKLQDFYETTLDALKDAKNERLWFKTMTKLGKLYFDREDYGKLSRILKQLHTSCTTQEGKHM